MDGDQYRFSWVGNQYAFLDNPDTNTVGHVVIGRYGGTTSAGATMNEDGALVWTDASATWELVLLLDAHATAESAALVIAAISSLEDRLLQIISRDPASAFAGIEQLVVELFQSESFRRRCRETSGETACLLCVRKAQYLWWFNVGDNMLFVIHPDLLALGQTMLNQRNFYEWIGNANTFDLDVPCYSVGVRELRRGENTVVVTTDGILTTENNPNRRMSQLFRDRNGDSTDLSRQVRHLLNSIQDDGGRDSATVIAWTYTNPKSATMPSR